ncbi:MAG: magnesium-translocating P-type ATPase [Clostridia bacterium]|nr:magnesium-translocating P-type ATPase [Clostridia bacterium]
MSEQEQEEKIDIQKVYGEINNSSIETFLQNNQFSLEGLSQEDVIKRQEKYGKNQMKQAKAKKWYHYLWQSFFSPFNLILLGIAFVLFYIDVILPEEPSYANLIVVISLIIISTFLEFFEVFKSNKAAEKLKKLVAVKTTVLRDGKEEKIYLDEITIGDVVLLSAGELIPADLRIVEQKDLYVVQSSLTGESDSVRKVQSTENKKIDDITDLDTICFMGTNVMSGIGKGIVFRIADDTYFGKIAQSIEQGKPKTNFQKGIESVSKLLIRFMLVLIPITFLVNSFKHDTLTAFTFAVAIAIGITPLLLPVILSSSLAKGAMNMSKKKTIVKKLDSIQSFGAMNILCTDKTGTLTEDKIVLEKYLNLVGEEDSKVLETAFLNSYFQTGLKGNIDEAVIKRVTESGLQKIAEEYAKVDEVPFDFSRRRLSVILSIKKEKKPKVIMITKGAVEETLSICNTVLEQDVKPITSEIKSKIKKMTKELNENGLRVIAICVKEVNEKKFFSKKDEEKMTLIGFVGFLDPPKKSSKEEIARLNRDGIRVIVLTGDNEYVTKSICQKVDINTDKIVLGSKVDKLSDMALARLLKKTNVFAKLSPIQKARIVRVLKEQGNIVGYMGDGINDAPSLKNSEVGISVDTAVDITKETADIILLKKNLNVLTDGVMEGRKTFGNLLKYIKMAVSFNFGEVLSILIASIFLPFFPITPIQLLVQSLLYDIGQLSLPYDHVDHEYLQKPKRWSMNSIKHFMLWMGPTSSIFDLFIFVILWFGFQIREAAIFQSIWFSYGVVSNLVGLHIIRTAKVPFIQSNSSYAVYATSILLSLIAIAVPFTPLGALLGLTAVPLKYIVIVIIGVPILYCFIASIVKKEYIKRYGEWL